MENTCEPTTATALLRGATCRCPACGEGPLFRKFLKVKDRCDACGEDLHHHRADDMPAYIVMSIVGHIVIGLLLWVETSFAPSIWIHIALWVPLTLGLSLGLLQPVKGTIVALQWALRMHGFGARRSRDSTTNLQRVA
ncbi:DUF983 domain-containing protein [Hyphomicrobium sp. NDB2Meth4]|uniref:DUF983 domain-containing protein n=1 Tax=Hyphomicrobium sp. NDB2Meth4 TaxID=1892846 RepID=UPI000930BF30|nr:DUF983 domain-containing protein [Hyphomicrobium sp. NDB2Meth4]